MNEETAAGSEPSSDARHPNTYKLQSRLALVGGSLIVALAVAVLVYFGRGRPALANHPRDVDFVYWYVAGLTWRAGLTPYHFEEYREVGRTIQSPVRGETIQCSFGYAPTVAALVIPFSYLPPEGARNLLALLNIMAALVVGGYLAFTTRRQFAWSSSGDEVMQPLILATIVAMAIAGPAAALNLYMGQSTLLCLGLVCLASWLGDLDWPILCGITLGLASFKIIVPLVVILLLAGEQRWKTLMAAGITGLLLASIPLHRNGPITLAHDWLDAMRLYRQFYQNRPGFEQTFGLSSVLQPLGIPYAWVPVLAVGGVVWLFLRRFSLTALEKLAVALAIPILFVQSHKYDVIALVPLYLAAMLAGRRSAWLLVPAVCAVALLMSPQSLWNVLFPGWRLPELLSLLLLGAVVCCVEWRRRYPAPIPNSGPGEASYPVLATTRS